MFETVLHVNWIQCVPHTCILSLAPSTLESIWIIKTNLKKKTGGRICLIITKILPAAGFVILASLALVVYWHVFMVL